MGSPVATDKPIQLPDCYSCRRLLRNDSGTCASCGWTNSSHECEVKLVKPISHLSLIDAPLRRLLNVLLYGQHSGANELENGRGLPCLDPFGTVSQQSDSRRLCEMPVITENTIWQCKSQPMNRHWLTVGEDLLIWYRETPATGDSSDNLLLNLCATIHSSTIFPHPVYGYWAPCQFLICAGWQTVNHTATLYLHIYLILAEPLSLSHPMIISLLLQIHPLLQHKNSSGLHLAETVLVFLRARIHKTLR